MYTRPKYEYSTATVLQVASRVTDLQYWPVAEALFSSKNFWEIEIVVFSFVFDKIFLIMD
jgi:hypothetical protein